MNRHFRRTFYVFALGFVALVGMLAYWQVYARESLANNPENSLQTRRALEAPRGFIFAGDGETILAQSKEQPAEDGRNPTYNRIYPQGPLYAGIVGYWSTRYGATGIEIAENANLSGTADPSTLDELINQMSGGPQPGNNVVLTIDHELQQIAFDAIANSNTGRGSLVAIDPQTGEILAMASYPSYDPNNIDEVFPELLEDPNEPLLNRATQGLYSPGSVFKVVTAAAALKSGVSPSDRYVDSGTYEQSGYTVVNYDDGVYGAVNFAQALALSINTIFAEVAVESVGIETLTEVSQDFGYGDEYEDFSLPVAPSRLGEGNIAQIAFGQDTNVSNVFEMAIVAASIANDGTMMEPTLIREVRSPDGVIIDRPQPQEKRQVLEPETANTLQDMMVGVIEEGTATVAQRPGVEIAGKTGTAEVPPNAPNSWFIASAPADDPQIAVAAMIENGGDGERQGLPVAMEVIDAYLDTGRSPENDDLQDLGPDGLPEEIPEGLPQELPENLPQGLPENLPEGFQQDIQDFINENQG
jgi:penicillin-binding protein A